MEIKNAYLIGAFFINNIFNKTKTKDAKILKDINTKIKDINKKIKTSKDLAAILVAILDYRNSNQDIWQDITPEQYNKLKTFFLNLINKTRNYNYINLYYSLKPIIKGYIEDGNKLFISLNDAIKSFFNITNE